MRRTTGCALAMTVLMVTACGGGNGETADIAVTTVEPAPTTAGGTVSETTTPMETTVPTTEAPATTRADTSDPYDYGPAESEATTTMGSTTTAAAGGGDTIVVSETEMGSFLTTADGWSLYLFAQDDQGESTCYDDCEAAWPPLTGEFAAGESIDPELIGSVTREDGSEQITYNGWPLYYYAQDAEPGDTDGHGAFDVWFLVTPEGEQVP